MSESGAPDIVRLMALPADGIGPKITPVTIQVLQALGTRLGLNFDFERFAIGFDALAREGTTFPDRLIVQSAAFDGIILEPVSHNDYRPPDRGGLDPAGELRKRLDLYANIRPAKSYPDFPPRC